MKTVYVIVPRGKKFIVAKLTSRDEDAENFIRFHSVIVLGPRSEWQCIEWIKLEAEGKNVRKCKRCGKLFAVKVDDGRSKGRKWCGGSCRALAAMGRPLKTKRKRA